MWKRNKTFFFGENAFYMMKNRTNTIPTNMLYPESIECRFSLAIYFFSFLWHLILTVCYHYNQPFSDFHLHEPASTTACFPAFFSSPRFFKIIIVFARNVFVCKCLRIWSQLNKILSQFYTFITTHIRTERKKHDKCSLIYRQLQNQWHAKNNS